MRIKAFIICFYICSTLVASASTLNDKRQAAEHGDVNAQMQLGEAYKTGTDGVEVDLTKSMKWFRKAADQGNPHAMFMVGKLLWSGISIFRNIEEDEKNAIKWYRKAAEQGYGEALFTLGQFHHYGREGGFKQDYTQAVYWYRKAVEQGNNNARHYLSGMLKEGRGVKKDAAKAAELHQLAARNGHEMALHEDNADERRIRKQREKQKQKLLSDRRNRNIEKKKREKQEQEQQKQKREEAIQNKKVNDLIDTVKQAGLYSELKEWALVSNVCKVLEYGESDVSGFNCNDHVGSRFEDSAPVKNCQKQKYKISQAYNRDMEESCSLKNRYRNKFISIYGSENLNILLSARNKSSNYRKQQSFIENNYPYTEVSFSEKMESYLISADEKMSGNFRDSIKAESDKAFAESDFWGNLSKPSAADKIFKKHNSDMGKFSNSHKRNKFKQPSAKSYNSNSNNNGYKQKNKASNSKGNNVPTLSDRCLKKGGKYNSRTRDCLIVKQYDTVALNDIGTNTVYGNKSVPGTQNYSNNSVTNSRDASSKCSGQSHTVPSFTEEGGNVEPFNNLLGKITEHMDKMCGQQDYTTNNINPSSVISCEVIKKVKSKYFSNLTKERCTSKPLKFECNCRTNKQERKGRSL